MMMMMMYKIAQGATHHKTNGSDLASQLAGDQELLHLQLMLIRGLWTHPPTPSCPCRSIEKLSFFQVWVLLVPTTHLQHVLYIGHIQKLQIYKVHRHLCIPQSSQTFMHTTQTYAPKLSSKVEGLRIHHRLRKFEIHKASWFCQLSSPDTGMRSEINPDLFQLW